MSDQGAATAAELARLRSDLAEAQRESSAANARAEAAEGRIAAAQQQAADADRRAEAAALAAAEARKTLPDAGDAGAGVAKDQYDSDLGVERDKTVVAEERAAAAEAALAEAEARHAEEIAAERAKTAAAESRAEKSETNAAAWAAKYDRDHGEVETGAGISKCTGYVSDDGAHHTTLGGARRHRYAAEAARHSEMVRTGQAITRQDAQTLSALAEQVAETGAP